MCDAASPRLWCFYELEVIRRIRKVAHHLVRDHVVVKVGRDEQTLKKEILGSGLPIFGSCYLT